MAAIISIIIIKAQSQKRELKTRHGCGVVVVVAPTANKQARQ